MARLRLTMVGRTSATTSPRVRIVLLGIVAFFPFAVSACGSATQGDTSAAFQDNASVQRTTMSQSDAGQPVEYPQSVITLQNQINDGQATRTSFDVRQAGLMQIDGETTICILPPIVDRRLDSWLGTGFSGDSWQGFDAITRYFGGAHFTRAMPLQQRVQAWPGSACSVRPKTIFIRTHAELNRHNGPYRLSMFAWQGEDVAWAARVERFADPNDIESWGPRNPAPPPPRMHDAVYHASSEITLRLVAHFRASE